MTVLDLVERIARQELIELLGDVEPPPASGPVRVRSTEEELAARLAAEHHGECWATFAAGAVDAGFAGRALDLYAFATPWLDGDDAVAAGAAELLIQIADGYALLSHPVAIAPLPLPLKAFAEVVMRALAIDGWAAALGHPLELDAAEADYQLEHREDPVSDDRDPHADLDGALSVAALRHELLKVLCDSPTGRTALQSDGFRGFAVERLAEAYGWSYWVRTEDEGKTAQRLVRMAETWFIAAHGAAASSRDVSV
ncbi:hypothetical protein [Solirubrobacter soli]|uniref:hypothetical protein n=1 Tax=Solirubrobacter soli TaxID=363832 RepID=UPI0004126A75|nr:hypothetical protein [Solirubrobacter soli]